jgi:hypothetical protein
MDLYLRHQTILRNSVLKKLKDSQPIKKFPSFIEHKCSLPYLQEPKIIPPLISTHTAHTNTRRRAERSGFDSQRGTIHLIKNVQTGSWIHLVFYTMHMRDLHTEVMRPADVKNTRRYTSTHPYVWLTWCGKHKQQLHNTFVYFRAGQLSQYSVWLRTGRQGDQGSIPGRAKGFFL